MKLSIASTEIQERVKRLSVALRQPYIDYIGEISAEQPADWWRSSVSEKNPYISNTFFYVCCLKACLDYVASTGADPRSLLVEQSAMRRALNRNLKSIGSDARLSDGFLSRSWEMLRGLLRLPLFQVYFLRNAIKIFYARYVYRLHETKTLKVLRGTPLSLTHIWVDLRAYSPETGELKNPDFGQVSAYLQSRGKVVASVAEILFQGKLYRRILGQIAQSQTPFLVLHSFLRMRDLIACLWYALIRIPQQRAYPLFQGLDITDLISNDLWNEWFTQRQAETILMERRIERMKQSGIVVERFIYAFENHTWERVACNSLRSAYPSAKLVGYQPNGLPLMLMNYFISEVEPGRIPLPDRIVANGPYSQRVLAKGYGQNRVVLGGALRQAHLQPLLSRGTVPVHQRASRLRILVTPSISRARTIELVGKIIKAFGKSSELDVIIKCHPSVQFEAPTPAHIRFSVEHLMKLLPTADLLIYNDGTFAAAEALAYGIPVVFVEPDYGLSLDSLDGFPDAERVVRTAEEIAAAVSDLLNSSELDSNRLDVVRQLAGEVTEKTFELFAEL